jgi:hypothetical protein
LTTIARNRSRRLRNRSCFTPFLGSQFSFSSYDLHCHAPRPYRKLLITSSTLIHRPHRSGSSHYNPEGTIPSIHQDSLPPPRLLASSVIIELSLSQSPSEAAASKHAEICPSSYC